LAGAATVLVGIGIAVSIVLFTRHARAEYLNELRDRAAGRK
jgi:hypothetical protein